MSSASPIVDSRWKQSECQKLGSSSAGQGCRRPVWLSISAPVGPGDMPCSRSAPAVKSTKRGCGGHDVGTAQCIERRLWPAEEARRPANRGRSWWGGRRGGARDATIDLTAGTTQGDARVCHETRKLDRALHAEVLYFALTGK